MLRSALQAASSSQNSTWSVSPPSTTKMPLGVVTMPVTDSRLAGSAQPATPGVGGPTRGPLEVEPLPAPGLALELGDGSAAPAAAAGPSTTAATRATTADPGNHASREA